ncbi:hypothetical protein [Hyphobacterium sp.]|jgi:hypothetical protein|uniref:hypothetical protein n=1 Tax=Hyphobacterium sp. TaxID=2004662 RepID=UPI003BA9CE7E
MILARLSRAIREQNWFAVVLEFVIVVAGVLLAFQITAWNADRIEHQRAERSLIDLRDDFAAIDDTASELAAFYQGVIHDLEILVRAVDAGEIAPGEMDAVRRALAYGDVFADPPPPSGTFRDLQGSGSLALVENQQLRLRLIEYEQSLGNISDSDANINVMLIPFSAAFKRHIRFDPQYHLPDTPDLAFYDVALPDVIDIDVDAILTDPEFEVAAQQHLRLQIGRFVNLRVSQSKIAQIRTMIDEALENTP